MGLVTGAWPTADVASDTARCRTIATRLSFGNAAHSDPREGGRAALLNSAAPPPSLGLVLRFNPPPQSAIRNPQFLAPAVAVAAACPIMFVSESHRFLARQKETRPWAIVKPRSIAGANSYHQIGLVRGQFGNVPEDRWLDWIAKTGFDGWEEASWELDLARCGDDAGAKQYAEERVAKAKSRGLEIFSVAAHLQGQALGDEPSAKTLQFLGGECVEAYARWRAAGNNRRGPIRSSCRRRRPRLRSGRRRRRWSAAVRLAHFSASCRTASCRSRALSARRPIAGATGSCFRRCRRRWADTRFPTSTRSAWSCSSSDSRRSFRPVSKYGTTYDLECHPSERAMGDIASAGEYLAAVDAAGFAKAAGFNFDCSHMEWQGVSGVEFIREHGDRIHCAHIKGVQVIDGYTRNGRLGGHRPMGDKHNGWNFVTAGTRARRHQHRAAAGRAEPGGLQRRGVDRMGRQRRRAARRRQAGAGQRPSAPISRPAGCGTTSSSRRRTRGPASGPNPHFAAVSRC